MHHYRGASAGKFDQNQFITSSTLEFICDRPTKRRLNKYVYKMMSNSIIQSEILVFSSGILLFQFSFLQFGGQYGSFYSVTFGIKCEHCCTFVKDYFYIILLLSYWKEKNMKQRRRQQQQRSAVRDTAGSHSPYCQGINFCCRGHFETSAITELLNVKQKKRPERINCEMVYRCLSSFSAEMHLKSRAKGEQQHFF